MGAFRNSRLIGCCYFVDVLYLRALSSITVWHFFSLSPLIFSLTPLFSLFRPHGRHGCDPIPLNTRPVKASHPLEQTSISIDQTKFFILSPTCSNFLGNEGYVGHEAETDRKGSKAASEEVLLGPLSTPSTLKPVSLVRGQPCTMILYTLARGLKQTTFKERRSIVLF